MSLQELNNYKGRILSVAAQFGAKNVRVFGSVAREEDDPNSDIDFLVEMEAGKTIFDRIGLKSELRKLLGKKVDVISDKAIKGRIKENILRDAVRL